MKKLLFLILVCFLVVFLWSSSAIFTQNKDSYNYVTYKQDIYAVRAGISKMWDIGFMPIAFEWIPDSFGGVNFFYVKPQDFGIEMEFTNWQLNWYDSPEQVDNDIRSKVRDGWIPVDISYTKSAFYALLLQTNTEIEDWKIEAYEVEDTNDLTLVGQLINYYSENDYLPMGLTAVDNILFALSVKIPGYDGKPSKLICSNNFLTEINNDIAKGWMPASLMLRWGKVTVVTINMKAEATKVDTDDVGTDEDADTIKLKSATPSFIVEVGDIYKMRGVLQKIVKSNSIPIGYEANVNWRKGAKGNYILSISPVEYNLDLKVTGIEINWYDSPAQVQDGIASRVSDGWIPIEISYCAYEYYAILIQANMELSDWKIVQTTGDIDGIKKAIVKNVDDGYTPIGITGWEGKGWILFINSPTFENKAWKIEKYDGKPEDVLKGITTRAKKGWIPSSLLMRWDNVYVLFIEASTK